MKRLELDFSDDRAGRRRSVGITALLLVCGLFVVAVQWHRAVDSRSAGLQSASEAAGQAVLPAAAESGQRELLVANEAARALNRPWGELLAALEQAQDSRVQLLVLQPNPRKGEVQLSGEAASFAALAEYLSRLRAQAVLGEVVLNSQRPMEEDGRQALAFTLTAEWAEHPAP